MFETYTMCLAYCHLCNADVSAVSHGLSKMI